MSERVRILQLEGCCVDFEARVVRHPTGVTSLTPLELKLLDYLVAGQGRAVPGTELLREVWGYRGGTRTRTLATTVRRLREKVEVDPNRPVHVRTVSGGGYRFDGHRTDPAAGRIPERAGSFVGRTAERVKIETAIAESRVVTVVGPVGAGKTRLAAEIAATSSGPWVWVDLLGAAGREEVLQRIGRALGATGARDEGELDRLLAGRAPLRVVLDDGDGAVAGIAAVLGTVRASTGWLVTSREPLAMRIEQVIGLEGLPADDAARLFEDRTGLARTADVDELVARVDGLPLALELAAGWIPGSSVSDLLRLDPLVWLAGPRRDGSARHGSIRAALEGSVAALSDAEREVLRALSMFAGPAPADALDAVAGAHARSAVRVLADRSLVRVEGEGVRPYRVVAHLAGERLPAEAWARAHGTWYARLGSPEILGAVERGDARWQATLEASRDELAVAAERAAARGDSEQAVALASALAGLAAVGSVPHRVEQVLEVVIPVTSGSVRGRLLAELATLHRRRGRRAEALAAVTAGLACAGADAPARGRLLRVRAQMALASGDFVAANEALQEALAAAEQAAEPVLVGLLLGHLGFLRGLERRFDEAESAIRSALDRMRADGQRRYQAMLLANLAQIVTDDGRDATPLYREAVATHRALGARHAEAVIRIGWGDALADRGDSAGAHREYGFARETLEAIGSPWLAARAAVNDAAVWLRDGDHAIAESLLVASLPVLEAAGDRPFVAVARASRALLRLADGEPALALHELDGARQALGDGGDPEVLRVVSAAVAVAERVSGRRDRARDAARAESIGLVGPAADLAALIAAEVPTDDPRWEALAAQTDEFGRLAGIVRRWG